MRALLVRMLVVLAGGLMGLVAGCFGGANSYVLPRAARADYFPLPHHVPQYEGGVSFRFAMAHDVIHERFPKHGPAHYRERNRLTREKLAKLAPDDPAAFSLADDLGAGLDRLGQPGEAATILRDKLARQEAAGLRGRDLYTSYANLGTFLNHESLPKAVAGDPAARERFREGLALVRKSVEVNPAAHFGRERWQVVIGEFLLAAMERPDLLKTFDFLGNRLDHGTQEALQRDESRVRKIYGRPFDFSFGSGDARFMVPAFYQPDARPDEPEWWEALRPIRDRITQIGAEDGWKDVAVPSHRTPVPFDEPTLGIIGIWRQGSGANPHFALALGETMLRVGQRYIAWAAYERAAQLAARFSPDPAAQQFLRDHCRKRQGQIEETASFVPPSFDEELAHGEGYQRAYQEYEAEKIAAGVPIADAPFFDEFHAGREPIASPVGPEDTFAITSRMKTFRYRVQTAWAWGIFIGGLAAMATSLLLEWGRRARARRARQQVGG